MTRETKIGLLVGLAFIIVIGILLSDHIQSATEPPQAKLADAGKTAQQAVNTLGANTPPPITVVTPQSVQPQQTVPTNADLNPRPQQTATSVVTISPGAGASQPPVNIVQQDQPKKDVVVITPAPTTPTQTPTPAAVAHNNKPPTAGADSPDMAVAPAGGIREVARQNGEELIPTGPTASNATNSATAVATASGKAYKAEAGDTVSKMALKFFGANTKTNRELIVKANPSLHDNPDKVIVGRTYAIPTAEAPVAVAPAAVVSAEAPTALKRVEPTPADTATASAASMEYWYTVRPGDSLWRIATEQCGNAGAVAAIKDLNKDVLKGAEVVKVDMKLRLPARPVASAN